MSKSVTSTGIKDYGVRGKLSNPYPLIPTPDEQEAGAPGLYIHVPFCKTKCPYCDFYSVTDLTLVEGWLRALKKEMNLYRNNFGTFDSLYIGGGTPTVLSDPAMTSLFEELHNHFSFAHDTEITVEVNPDDISLKKLELLKSLGVNRLSIGVQSFNDDELKLLKRRHTHQGAEKALRFINSAGFTNFGIDLMYGLPGQDLESWIETLRKALTFYPTHMSCYQLTFEETTPFGKMLEQGSLQACTEKQGKDFFLATSSFLEQNGFIHYEISNFSKGNEFRSRHNCKYWHHIPYLSLGPGAHSFRNGLRWWNVRSIEDYCSNLQKGLRPIGGSETLTSEQFRLEKLMLGFRTRDGVLLDDACPEYTPNGLLEDITKMRLVSIHGNRLIPSKKGFLMADQLPLLFP
jgi:oxygen-independent coproporphyrinogen-3 oxidase